MIDVDDTNLEEYLERVLEMTLGSGIERQIKAFQEGKLWMILFIPLSAPPALPPLRSAPLCHHRPLSRRDLYTVECDLTPRLLHDIPH